MVLVSGSGRNCGKTTVACNLITQLSENEFVYGLKITPHFHLTGQKQELLIEEKDFKIFRETDLNSGKDTSRMLSAGAKEVYFIQCKDSNVDKAFKVLSSYLTKNIPVICESGSFANVYKPGFHLLIEGIDIDPTKASYNQNLKRADLIINQADYLPNDLGIQLTYSGAEWTLNKFDHAKVRRSA